MPLAVKRFYRIAVIFQWQNRLIWTTLNIKEKDLSLFMVDQKLYQIWNTVCSVRYRGFVQFHSLIRLSHHYYYHYCQFIHGSHCKADFFPFYPLYQMNFRFFSFFFHSSPLLYLVCFCYGSQFCVCVCVCSFFNFFMEKRWSWTLKWIHVSVAFECDAQNTKSA